MTVEMLHPYYPEAYYGRIPQPEAVPHRSTLLAIGRILYRKVLRGQETSRMACFLPPSWMDLALPARQAPGRLLDVGAGWGRFVAGAIGMGWQPEVLDPGPLSLRVGDRLNIPAYQGTLEEHLPYLGGAYDLVSLNHVLEHVPSPAATLRAVKQVLADDGVVRIQVPLWRASLVRLFGKYWSALDLPRHRFHFRPSEIRRLAREAGFNRTLHLPETGTHSLSLTLQFWLRDHPGLEDWKGIGSIDNRLLRAVLYPFGWFMAVLQRPLEATFYLMRK